jgi:Transposase DDE domain
MTVFTAMLERIRAILQRIEDNRPRHGNETIHWMEFVIALLFFFTKGCDSAADWARALEDAEPALNLPKIPRSTLSSKFYDFDPQLLHQVIRELLLQTFPTNPDLALIGQLDAVDGSFFRVIGGVFNRITRKWDHNVKLHLDLNLNSMLPVAFISDSATSDERAAFLSMITRGVTYILDRGYMAFYVLRHVIDQEAFVVLRTYESVVVTTVETFVPTLPAHMRAHWTNISDRLVMSSHKEAQGLIFRLVECTIGDVTYRLMTNRFDLTTYHILLIYAYRWQVELMFRFLKHTIGSKDVITQCPAGIETFFAGMLLTALLQSHFKIDCLAQEGYVTPDSAPYLAMLTDISGVHPHDTPESAGQPHDRILPEEPVRIRADQTEQSRTPLQKVQTSRDTTRPTIIRDVALFMNEINQRTMLFWKIPKHWLNTLRDCLHRQFTAEIVSKLNKRALQYTSGP